MRFRTNNPSALVFVAIIVLLVIWIGGGMLGRDAPEATPQVEARVPTVAASWSEAEEITRELVLYGDVEPAQVSILRARTDGIVERIAEVGERVESGDPLAQLSTDDREAQLARARAQVASTQRDYDAAAELFKRGVGTRPNAQANLAQLEAARADLRAVELDIANTELRAPITGVISRLIADVGSYVTTGGEVLEIVDNDPLVAVVNVQQSAITRVKPGMSARVRFIGGMERDGVVRFVSPIGDASTRTFRVEVDIDNSDGEMPSGISAEVIIPFATIAAHRVSPAMVRLDDQGRIGLNLVDDDARIVFAPIEVVRARADGLWVSGLPERARLVTISHGSLLPGQQIEVRETPPEFLGQVAGDHSSLIVDDEEAGAAPEGGR